MAIAARSSANGQSVTGDRSSGGNDSSSLIDSDPNYFRALISGPILGISVPLWQNTVRDNKLFSFQVFSVCCCCFLCLVSLFAGFCRVLWTFRLSSVYFLILFFATKLLFDFYCPLFFFFFFFFSLLLLLLLLLLFFFFFFFFVLFCRTEKTKGKLGKLYRK